MRTNTSPPYLNYRSIINLNLFNYEKSKNVQSRR